MILVVQLTMFSTCVGSAAVDDSGCLPWTYRPNSISPCQCGSSVQGAIKCEINASVLILQECLCGTYDPVTSESVAGYCPYSCIAYLGEQVYKQPMTKDNFLLE